MILPNDERASQCMYFICIFSHIPLICYVHMLCYSTLSLSIGKKWINIYQYRGMFLFYKTLYAILKNYLCVYDDTRLCLPQSKSISVSISGLNNCTDERNYLNYPCHFLYVTTTCFAFISGLFLILYMELYF